MCTSLSLRQSLFLFSLFPFSISLSFFSLSLSPLPSLSLSLSPHYLMSLSFPLSVVSLRFLGQISDEPFLPFILPLPVSWLSGSRNWTSVGVRAQESWSGMLPNVFFSSPEPLCIHPTRSERREATPHSCRAHHPRNHHLCLCSQVQENIAGGGHYWGERTCIPMTVI